MSPRAQDWPTKPVTLIVPFAPGGTHDIVGRILAQQMTGRSWPDRRGRECRRCRRHARRHHCVARGARRLHHLHGDRRPHHGTRNLQKLAYNFEQDFDPITIVATVPNILIVNPARAGQECRRAHRLSEGQSRDRSATARRASAAPNTCRPSCSAHSPAPTSSTSLSRRFADAGRSRWPATSKCRSRRAAPRAVGPGRHRARACGQLRQALAGVARPSHPRRMPASRATRFPLGTDFWWPRARPRPVRDKLYATSPIILKHLSDVIKRLSEFRRRPTIRRRNLFTPSCRAADRQGLRVTLAEQARHFSRVIAHGCASTPPVSGRGTPVVPGN